MPFTRLILLERCVAECENLNQSGHRFFFAFNSVMAYHANIYERSIYIT